jgi:hypothetical protein
MPIPRAKAGLKSIPTRFRTFAVLVLTGIVGAVIGGLGLGLASGEGFHTVRRFLDTR